MPSTYTTNTGIEKIATGEQSGTWGNTTNTNLDLIDQSTNGIVEITVSSAATSGSPNSLPITNGALSNGRNVYIEFKDGGDLGGTVFYQLDPNDAEKVVHVRNNLTNQALILFQGTYNSSNDIEIPNGKDMVVKFDGAGSGATVEQIDKNLNPSQSGLQILTAGPGSGLGLKPEVAGQGLNSDSVVVLNELSVDTNFAVTGSGSMTLRAAGTPYSLQVAQNL